MIYTLTRESRDRAPLGIQGVAVKQPSRGLLGTETRGGTESSELAPAVLSLFPKSGSQQIPGGVQGQVRQGSENLVRMAGRDWMSSEVPSLPPSP